MPEFKEPAQITFGAEHVSIKRRGRSAVQVATILGRESRDDGEHVWLDRVVHAGTDEEFADGWQGHGAVVTELIRGTAEAL